MKSALLVDTDSGVQSDVAAGSAEPETVSRAGVVEGWLHDHFTFVALTVMAAGFAVRFLAAANGYLDPDEAIHYVIIHQPSLYLAYKTSLTNAHPPLFFLVLYVCHLLSSSELMLRLPSVLCGTAFCWFAFKWIGAAFGRTSGIIGLVIATFCPALIDLSAEVRDYSLLLFSMAVALYFLAKALEEGSIRGMWCYSAFLYLAILTHYSAVFFVLATGLYCLARIGDSRFPRKVALAWAGGQAGALAIYGFLYVTHISKLKDNIARWGQPFYGAYFHPENTDFFEFARVRTSNIFQYLFEQPDISQTMLLFFVVGLVFLFFRGLLPRNGQPRSCHLAILLLLPFMIAWGFASLGRYPYVGSRHTVFLAPFAIAAVSYFLAAVANKKLWVGVTMAVLLMAAANASGNPPEPYIPKEDQRRTSMMAAMNEIQKSISPGERILVDFQSRYPIQYYLCGPAAMVSVDRSHGGFENFSCNRHSIVSLDEGTWKFPPGNFSTQFHKMAQAYGLQSGDRVWVFQTGWGLNLDVTLPEYFPKFRCLTPRTFGARVSLIPFVVGPDLSPTTPLSNCSN